MPIKQPAEKWLNIIWN